MRGIRNDSQTNLFSYVQLEDRIPANHPLRKIRQMVDLVLGSMNDVFKGEARRENWAPFCAINGFRSFCSICNRIAF
ncbi:hypothetical protein [Chromobacterium amazonense]|uniref:hypothetical protein n=1 Tax=Chromobacterium amazonense TaxID=1382803 RepID=UPI003F78F8B6